MEAILPSNMFAHGWIPSLLHVFVAFQVEKIYPTFSQKERTLGGGARFYIGSRVVRGGRATILAADLSARCCA